MVKLTVNADSNDPHEGIIMTKMIINGNGKRDIYSEMMSSPL